MHDHTIIEITSVGYDNQTGELQLSGPMGNWVVNADDYLYTEGLIMSMEHGHIRRKQWASVTPPGRVFRQDIPVGTRPMKKTWLQTFLDNIGWTKR